jgi:hypothetical protein
MVAVALSSAPAGFIMTGELVLLQHADLDMLKEQRMLLAADNLWVHV